jgi:hypothetical protein
MKKNRAFISTIVLVVLASLSCAQSSDKTVANRSAAFAPELRWKYESDG